MLVYFCSDREQPYGCFSNFSARGFAYDPSLMDDLWRKTSEHFFKQRSSPRLTGLGSLKSARLKRLLATNHMPIVKMF